MARVLTVSDDRIDPLTLVRPAAIWLGLAVFLFGSILFGNALTGTGTQPFEGPLFMLLGVALVGGGFTMDASEFEYDPEIEFSGLEYYVVAGLSALFLLVAIAVLVLGVL
jgi:hypothetical protein